MNCCQRTVSQRLHLIAVAIAVSCGARVGGAQTWRVVPQICQGRPYSSAAKASDWEAIPEKRACRVTSKHRPMVTGASLAAEANFAMHIRFELPDKAALRLTVGKGLFQLKRRGDSLRLLMEGMTHEFKLPAESPWTMLHIKRHDGLFTVKLNGREVLRRERDTRAFDQIALQTIKGAIDVSHFVVSGQLEVGELGRR